MRTMVEWVAGAGARGVQIDATMAGVRPRELDRSGRRDLASLLRRVELVCTGVDVFVPPEHFASPQHADRAVSSVLGAIEMAADLAALSSGSIVTRLSRAAGAVSLTLPDKTPPDVLAAIAAHASTCGVSVANFAWPIAEESGDGTIGVGLDPATAMAAGEDPIALAARLGKRLAGARLSDLAKGVGAGRVAPGEGRLDVGAYMVTLATTGYTGAAVLDLHGLRTPGRAIADVVERARAMPGV